jgi:hypothetical protein
MRDARLGAAFAVLPRARSFPGDDYGLTARFELALPTGDESSFAGDRSFVGIPSLSGDFRRGPFMAGAELGARIRKTSDLSGSRVGPELVIALGIGAELRESDKLSLHLEAIALPNLVAQEQLAFVPGTDERVATGSRPLLMPAEWQASIRTAELFGGDASLSLGGGGSLGLTGESGITSPSYRFTLAIRYAPLGRAPANASE